MLDTHCRKIVQPLIEKIAKLLIKNNYTPNQITVFALFLGVISSFFIYFDFRIIGVFILWSSGVFDAVDGTMARLLHQKTQLGTLMDITFDRIVEGGIILAFATKNPQYSFLLLILVLSIVLSMTIFLTSGAIIDKKSEKSFYYQAGVAERTEGFIMLSLMVIFQKYSIIIIIIFILMILITAVQRFIETKKILEKY